MYLGGKGSWFSNFGVVYGKIKITYEDSDWKAEETMVKEVFYSDIKAVLRKQAIFVAQSCSSSSPFVQGSLFAHLDNWSSNGLITHVTYMKQPSMPTKLLEDKHKGLRAKKEELCLLVFRTVRSWISKVCNNVGDIIKVEDMD